MYKNLASTCVKVVETQWLDGVKLICLTHSLPGFGESLGKNQRVSPMFSCELSKLFPQLKTAFNSYVFQLSPQYTGPIKTTTKYIKEYL